MNVLMEWFSHFLHPPQFTSQSRVYYHTHSVSDPIIIIRTLHYSGCYDALWMLICSPRTTYINLFSTKRHKQPLRVWPSPAFSLNEENRVGSKVDDRAPPLWTDKNVCTNMNDSPISSISTKIQSLCNIPNIWYITSGQTYIHGGLTLVWLLIHEIPLNQHLRHDCSVMKAQFLLF